MKKSRIPVKAILEAVITKVRKTAQTMEGRLLGWNELIMKVKGRVEWKMSDVFCKSYVHKATISQTDELIS